MRITDIRVQGEGGSSQKNSITISRDSMVVKIISISDYKSTHESYFLQATHSVLLDCALSTNSSLEIRHVEVTSAQFRASASSNPGSRLVQVGRDCNVPSSIGGPCRNMDSETQQVNNATFKTPRWPLTNGYTRWKTFIHVLSHGVITSYWWRGEK